MKQNDLLTVYQCTSRFLEKAHKTQYLGVPTIVSPSGVFAKSEIDWNTGTPIRKLPVIS